MVGATLAVALGDGWSSIKEKQTWLYNQLVQQVKKSVFYRFFIPKHALDIITQAESIPYHSSIRKCQVMS